MRPPHDHHRTCQHRQYYLTCEEFNALWQHTGGHCWRCGVHESETKANKLAIDHDQHNGAGSVRGLLCYSCNQYLESMDRAGQYDGPATRYLGMMAEVLPVVLMRTPDSLTMLAAREAAWAQARKDYAA